MTCGGSFYLLGSPPTLSESLYRGCGSMVPGREKNRQTETLINTSASSLWLKSKPFEVNISLFERRGDVNRFRCACMRGCDPQLARCCTVNVVAVLAHLGYFLQYVSEDSVKNLRQGNSGMAHEQHENTLNTLYRADSPAAPITRWQDYSKS
ncbi:hypothetical protein PO909_029015 [Leuciscus waleckii]